MKLLVVTQKVDLDDSVLGFFHRWLEELSKHFENITVISLETGRYDLPGNVEVLSLGKENNPSHLLYLYRFYKYIFRADYDIVFIHMNQEYVLLGGLVWRLMGKKVFIWRNHPDGSFFTKIAVLLSSKVFYTSPKAFVARFSNSFIMPVGIDTKKFKPAPIPVEYNSILILSRLSPIKRLEEMISGLKELDRRGVEYKADIIGDALLEYAYYEERLKDMVRYLGLGKKVRILPAISHEEAPAVYRRYKLFINLTPDGSLDKTIFEALASGLKVVVANSFFREWLPKTWVVKDPDNAKELGETLSIVLTDSHNRNSETQGRISVLLKEHSLKFLADRLEEELS